MQQKQINIPQPTNLNTPLYRLPRCRIGIITRQLRRVEYIFSLQIQTLSVGIAGEEIENRFASFALVVVELGGVETGGSLMVSMAGRCVHIREVG
jgi:hypothetical protein